MDIIKEGLEAAKSILGMTSSLISKYPSRITGTKGSAGAADAIMQTMKEFCNTVSLEAFPLHPGSLFNIGRIISIVYLLSIILLYVGGSYVYVSLVLCVIALVYAFIHYFLFGQFFDKLFKKRTGLNAIGILEPSDEVKQQFVLTGHHDSPHVFSFFTYLKPLAGIRFLLGIIFYLFITVLSLIAAVSTVLHSDWHLEGALMVLSLTGLLFSLPLFFFISTKVSPGAGDNLNGSSIALHVGKFFVQKVTSRPTLKHTRLIIISTDGEEAGQRGAIAYVRRHLHELKSSATEVLNFDSIYSLKELTILLRDRHGLQPLSAQMADQCMGLADELGYHLKVVRTPFGSGTDAAAFARENIKATCIIGMPTSLFVKDYIYHTPMDTVEHIEQKAVAAVFDIAVNYIARSDRTLTKKKAGAVPA